MKKTTVIAVIVIVFIIIGVVVYLFLNSNKDAAQITKTTQSNGLGNLFANTGTGWISSIFSNKNKQIAKSPTTTQSSGQALQQQIANSLPV